MTPEQMEMARELGRLFVARRQRAPYTCSVCGAEAVGYVGARYCSNRCRQRAKYARQKQSERTSSPE